MVRAVGGNVLDVFRTFGTAVAHTKVVKDIAKVAKGLIDAGVFGNAAIKDSSAKLIGAVDFLEFGESLAYVAKWIDRDYTGKNDPKTEPVRKNVGQLSLFATRFFSFTKALNTYSLVTVEQWNKLGSVIPVLRDHLSKVPAFDTLSGIFYIPFGSITLFDHVREGHGDVKLAFSEVKKVEKWLNKSEEQVANRQKKPLASAITDPIARRAAKIDLHKTEAKKHALIGQKHVSGGLSASLKITAATTAVVAALFFGGVAGVAGALVFIGLGGNLFSLAKNFNEAYMEKYTPLYEGNIANAKQRIAAAAA